MIPRTEFKAAAICLIIGLLLAHVSVPAAQASLLSNFRKSKELKVRTTAYTHTESDHLQHGKKTAAGTTLQSGKINSAAADWSFLPVGTTFRIKGDDTLYKVEDYGRALVGTETIDIYRPSSQSMNRWGVRNVEIEIIEKGCVKRSLELLSGRTHFAHCQEMFDKLKEQL